MDAPAGWTAQLELHKLPSGTLDAFIVRGTAPVDKAGQTYSIRVIKDVPDADGSRRALCSGNATIDPQGNFEFYSNVGLIAARNATYGSDYPYEIHASQPDPQQWNVHIGVGIIGRGKTNVNL